METISLNELLKCVRRWNDVRTGVENEKEMKGLFHGKALLSFDYKHQHDFDLHIYPGIDANNNLVYFVLSAFYDTDKYRDTLNEYVTLCTPVPSTSNEEIDPKEALKRIHNWGAYHQEWIPQQLASKNGMYQAFTVPKEDLKSQRYTCYFALEANPKQVVKASDPNPPQFTADLIIVEGLSNANAFYDTVRPVPPFKSSIDRAGFYLLKLAGVSE